MSEFGLDQPSDVLDAAEKLVENDEEEPLELEKDSEKLDENDWAAPAVTMVVNVSVVTKVELADTSVMICVTVSGIVTLTSSGGTSSPIPRSGGGSMRRTELA